MSTKGLDIKKFQTHPPIMLTGIPLPPSDNGQYSSVIAKTKRGHKLKRIPSRNSRDYKQQFHNWAISNMQSVVAARNAVKTWEKFISVDIFLCISQGSILTLAGKIKKIDTTNRDKLLLDLLSRAIGVDDSKFNAVRMEKVLTGDKSQQTIIVLRSSELRGVADVYDQLTEERIL